MTNNWQGSNSGAGRLQGAGDEMCIRQVGNICSPPCIVPSFFLFCHCSPYFHSSDLTALHLSYVPAEDKAGLER